MSMSVCLTLYQEKMLLLYLSLHSQEHLYQLFMALLLYSKSNGVHPLSRRSSLYESCFKVKYVPSCMANLRQKDSSRFGLSELEKLSPFCNMKLKSFQSIIVSAASEDGIAVNRSFSANSDEDMEK